MTLVGSGPLRKFCGIRWLRERPLHRRFAPVPSPATGRKALFNGDRFGEIAWLVYVRAFRHSGVVGEELDRNGIEQRRDEWIGLGHLDGCPDSVRGGLQPGAIRNQQDFAS